MMRDHAGMDPSTEVALALHSTPGVYAVLLGSGVSRAAGVPTGWEITLDLIERLAVATGTSTPSDPAAWYRSNYDAEPDYSEILEKLAATPSERQALLRGYFEPTDEAREEGIKQPTAAHRALADLARRGTVRIILTTNFDRLIEQALDAVGVPCDVWASSDAIVGGVPVSHGRVVVVKLHGDYRDTRLRNTLNELESYEPEVDDLLDRVLDEFGLIVCGWSGAWDAALRQAILRAPNRRYRTFWAGRHGRVDDAARSLVDHRQARIVPIEDADRFFEDVRNKVTALEEVNRPHPASTELAVAMVKRYLPDERDRIRLTDTVLEEAKRLRGRLGPERYPVTSRDVTTESIVGTAQRYEADAETMIHVLAHLSAHADHPRHFELAGRALEVVANPEGDLSGSVALISLRRYPALQCFYAAGIAAVHYRDWGMLRVAALEPRWHDMNHTEPLVAALHPFRVFENADDAVQALAGADPNRRLYTPLSDHLHRFLREPMQYLVDTEQRYDEAFDRFEYLAGLLLAHLNLAAREDPNARGVPPPYVGRLRWRYGRFAAIPVPVEWADAHASEIAPQLLAHTEDPHSSWDSAKEAYDEIVMNARTF